MVTILVVDDKPDLLDNLELAAFREGRNILKAGSQHQALKLIVENNLDLIVTDLKMEEENSGIIILETAKQKDIYTQVILVTVNGSKQISIEAMRKGAYDYIDRSSPRVSYFEVLREKIDKALEFGKLKRQNP